MRTTTRSPGAAASAGVAARARGPSSATRSLRVCGPRELLSTTSYPAATAPVIGIPERRWDGGEVRPVVARLDSDITESTGMETARAGELRRHPAVVTDLFDCPELFERVYAQDLRSTT